ncbi:MAG: NAD-dependent epimerase/dehydratase family protein, partial [Armatimonadota bacterium]
DEMDDGAFNVGGDRSVTVEEFARMLCAVAGARVEPVVSGEFRLGDARQVRSDVSRLKALGWQPRTPLATVASSYLAWLNALPERPDRVEPAMVAMRRLGVLRRST